MYEDGAHGLRWGRVVQQRDRPEGQLLASRRVIGFSRKYLMPEDFLKDRKDQPPEKRELF